MLYQRADVCCAGHSRRGMKQKLTGSVMGKTTIHWNHFEDCEERYEFKAIFTVDKVYMYVYNFLDLFMCRYFKFSFGASVSNDIFFKTKSMQQFVSLKPCNCIKPLWLYAPKPINDVTITVL